MPKEYREIIGANIRRLMEIRNMNQTQLAEELGVNKSTVNQWLSGAKTPRPERVEKLAEILRCTVSDITGNPADADGGEQQAYINEMFRKYGALFKSIDSLPADEQKQAADFIQFLKRSEKSDK